MQAEAANPHERPRRAWGGVKIDAAIFRSLLRDVWQATQPPSPVANQRRTSTETTRRAPVLSCLFLCVPPPPDAESRGCAEFRSWYKMTTFTRPPVVA